MLSAIAAETALPTEDVVVDQPQQEQKSEKKPRAKPVNHNEIKYEIPKSVFKRIVKKEAGDMLFTKEALSMLQTEAEAHAVRHLTNAGVIAENSGRQTVLKRDFEAVAKLQR